MSNKMMVLTISVDVGSLSQEQIEELQMAMEVQTEDYEVAILNSSVNEMDVDDLMEEEGNGLH